MSDEESLWSMLFELLQNAARSVANLLIQLLTEVIGAVSGVDLRVLLVSED